MAFAIRRTAPADQAIPQHHGLRNPTTYQPAPQTAQQRGNSVPRCWGPGNLLPSVRLQPASMHLVRSLNKKTHNDEDKDGDNEADDGVDEDDSDSQPQEPKLHSTPNSSTPITTPTITPTKGKAPGDGDLDLPLLGERLKAMAGGSRHDTPAGANMGLAWDASAGRNGQYVAIKKDHFTGAVRKRRMVDDMFDNAAPEKMREYKRRYCKSDEDEGEDEEEDDSVRGPCSESGRRSSDSEGSSAKRRKLGDDNSSCPSSSASASVSSSAYNADDEAEEDEADEEDKADGDGIASCGMHYMTLPLRPL